MTISDISGTYYLYIIMTVRKVLSDGEDIMYRVLVVLWTFGFVLMGFVW